jgi:hypothetical protein
MSDQNMAYTDKENAKSKLSESLRKYLTAAHGFDMNDDEITSELEDVFSDLGKNYSVCEN